MTANTTAIAILLISFLFSLSFSMERSADSLSFLRI